MLDWIKRRRALFRFTASSLAVMATTMGSNLLVIRWLAPEETGVWQTLLLVQLYLMFLQLGVFNGLAREYPYLQGRDEASEARQVCATALAHTLVCCGVAVIGLAVTALVYRDETMWLKGFASMAGFSAAQFLASYLSTTYRTVADFEQLALVQWLQCVVLVGSVPLVYWWGFDGMVVRLVMVPAWSALWLFRWRPIRVRPRYHRRALRRLLSAGTPAMLLGQLFMVANSLDRLVLVSLAGVTTVGLYAPASAVRSAMGSLPAAINQYITPRLNIELGRTGDPRRLWRDAWRSTLGTSLTLVPVAAIGWVVLPTFVSLLFPAYTAAIPATRLVALSGVFMGIQAGTAVVASLKAWLPMTVYTVANAVLLGGLPLGMMQLYEPLTAVAVGVLAARACILPIGLAVIYWATHSRRYTERVASKRDTAAESAAPLEVAGADGHGRDASAAPTKREP